MKEHYPLRGNVTTILSPFKEGTKEYDFDDLAREIDLAARGGCVGCLCPSGASEISTLTTEEKIEMVRVAAQAAEGRTLIIPSINWGTPEECAALGEAYLKAGADALNVSINYNNETENMYTRMLAQGLDLKTTWVEIGPKPHSHSGGLVIDRGYHTTLPGLYAAGEAVGGCQGADRAGGMGGGQDALTGYACGESIAKYILRAKAEGTFPEELPENTAELHECDGVYAKYIPTARSIANPVMQPMRNERDLTAAIAKLDEMMDNPEVRSDDITHATLISMRLMLNGALLRKESRGVHNREEYPEERPEFSHGIIQ